MNLMIFKSGIGAVATSLQSTDNEQPYSQFNNQNGSFHLSRRVCIWAYFLGLIYFCPPVYGFIFRKR